MLIELSHQNTQTNITFAINFGLSGLLGRKLFYDNIIGKSLQNEEGSFPDDKSQQN